MSKRAMVRCVLGGLTVALLAAPSLGDVWFQPVGFLHEFPTEIESASLGISPDGSLVVGRDVSHVGFEATRWTLAGGLVGMGDIPGSPALNSQASDASNNGVIVGYGAFNSDMQQAFRWTQADGMVGLGVLPGTTRGQGRGVSYDGSIVVGDCGPSTNYDAGKVPFRWTATTGLSPLGLPAGFTAAGANAISADGSVIVGDGSLVPFGLGAWRWTASDGFTNIGSLGGAFPFTRAMGVSGNGEVIFGNGYSHNGFEAFRWTAETGMVPLGDLPGGSYSSWANGGSNYDGSIIVGGSQSTEYASDAFIWDAAHGMRSLKHVLQDEYGLDLTGWNLEEAIGMSDDGQTITGWGYNPLGQREGWVVRIPEPGSLGLFLVGFGLALRRR
jgi:probable HAF family extracellular repeat protein